jgi:signal transduction histidine kinase
MKKQRLFTRLLFPSLIFLLLLPPLSCLIFQHEAKDYAFEEATRELDSIQKTLLPLIEDSFQTSQKENNTQSSSNTHNFLLNVGQISHHLNGNTKILVLGTRMQVIYPREEETEELSALAKEFAQELKNADLSRQYFTMTLNSENGEQYLAKTYIIPAQSAQLKYLITYCPTSQILSWIQHATFLVLIISSVFVLVLLAILLLTARSISQPIHLLCKRAKKIGNGDFSENKDTFSLKELDVLRIELNKMSHQLQQNQQVQKDFFQNISHELRNPLMSIGGYAQGIEQGVFHSSKEAAHTILEESQRLTNLVNSLLTLSRMESRQTPVELLPVQLADTLQNCLERLHGLALQKNISFCVTPFDEHYTISGDEELLEKILDNLISNAIRYAKKAITIDVLQEKNCLKISVADDGDGINGTDLPHLFERCYKGDDGNFGLGLSIAQTAAHSMNGQLTAANQTKGGAVFTLIIPYISD